MSDNGKKLYRDKENGWLGGVCAGLGEYFGVDPTVLRVLFIVFGLVGGWSVPIYIVLWFLVPLKPEHGAAVVEEDVDEKSPADEDAA